MRQTEAAISRPRSRAGFATAAVLGLLAIVALLSASALHDALFGEQLASSRLLQQRAAALAQLGLHNAVSRVAAMSKPEGAEYALRPLPPSNDSVSVKLRVLGSSALAAGFSSPLLMAHHFEIESTGHTARGVRVTQSQGIVRLLPVPRPAGEPPP